MPKKVWHKPLHKRKIWKKMSLLSKIIYYMNPFIEHLVDTWQQALPFPTMLKCIYSCILTVFILLPIIYPGAVLMFIYATMQFILQRHFGLSFPGSMDILNYAVRVINFEIPDQKYNLFFIVYIERWRIFGTAFTSSIDYIRLVLSLISNN